jgi:hypothetical protein
VPGTVVGVAEFDAELFAELPIALVAYTVNVYAVPAVRPVTVIVPDPDCETVPVMPPGDDVAVYDVIGLPPLSAGAVNVTFTDVEFVTAVAVPMVGAPGTLAAPPPRNICSNDILS